MPSHHKKHHPHHPHRRPPPLSDPDDSADPDPDSLYPENLQPDQPPPHDGNGGHRHHEMSPEEKIANLMQLNDTLVKQVASSRAAKDELSGKIKALEEDLESNVSRADALVMEKTWLEEEKHKSEVEVSSLRKEAAGLGAKRTVLLNEKQAELDSKQDLESALSESRARLEELTKQLDEAHCAVVSAQDNSHALKSEIERLLSEKRNLNEEISGLQARNSETEGDLKLLQAKQQSLQEELSDLRNDCATSERKIIDANKFVEALKAEVFKRTVETEMLQLQLTEAVQRIESLEAKREARVAKENELESQVQKLEDELLAAKSAYDSISAALQQEREARGSLSSLLETAHVKSRGLEGEINSMKSSVSKLQADTDRDQQLISSLEIQVSSLANEKAMLQQTKSALQEEVTMLTCGSTKASVEAKTEISKLSAMVTDLQHALAQAKEEASRREKNISQLETDLQELRSFIEKKSKVASLALPLAGVLTGTVLVLGISALRSSSQN